MLLTKHAALWLQSSRLDLDHIKWSRLKVEISDYFRTSDLKQHAQDKLASMTQKNSVAGYINAFKQCCAKVPSITDEEMLDRFMRGLNPDVQWELLK